MGWAGYIVPRAILSWARARAYLYTVSASRHQVRYISILIEVPLQDNIGGVWKPRFVDLGDTKRKEIQVTSTNHAIIPSSLATWVSYRGRGTGWLTLPD